MSDDDAFQMLGLDAPEKLLEAEHLLQGTDARLGSRGHDLGEAQDDERAEDTGRDERHRGEQKCLGEVRPGDADDESDSTPRPSTFASPCPADFCSSRRRVSWSNTASRWPERLVELTLQLIERHLVAATRKIHRTGQLVRVSPSIVLRR
jgi:hypothetical protein